MDNDIIFDASVKRQILSFPRRRLLHNSMEWNFRKPVFLSGAKNPLCYQGDPSDASLLRMTCISYISFFETAAKAGMTKKLTYK